ncbi:MAG: hypothetical protein IJX99_08405 [Clostridia bacterium]|nr:hypothetical protein [Clostridia bacterium]
MQRCEDNYFVTFSSYLTLLDFHEEQAKSSKWIRCPVNSLGVKSLDENSPLYGSTGAFAQGTTTNAVEDTAKNLGLAIQVEGDLYPVRITAYKSLLDRAKIGGTALPKLSRPILASTLNACLGLYNSEALVLVRNEKVSAVHSGDEVDYSILPMDELIKTLKNKLDERFPGNEFDKGYADHAMSSASWKMPNQKNDLIGAYTKMIASLGQTKFADKIVPGIRFMTSDTGISSAKVSALLLGGQHPIHIGGCVAVDHRHGKKVEDFEKALDQLFAQFGKSIAQLQKLLSIQLDYPVNAMTRVCKKLSMPKKAAAEAIAMFKMTCGPNATAHDVFMAMQEIPYNLKIDNTPESKMLTIEENMARALTLNWKEFDLATEVSY